ncbi:GNAT family N-acetyltransferase [Alistipes sp.]|uniref:GNAT family N-acetyltransferase n=1 Tax=Alistipes sp. TaxID=1872444 RepID=UPI003AF044C1
MTNLRGKTVRLRALEPEDLDLLYDWENDPSVWEVSGTLAPFSRNLLSKFIEQQQFDIYQTRQLRLVIENDGQRAVGLVDLFEFDPHNRRAGVGILVHDPSERGKGYASDALEVLVEYARTTLRLHQLWCNVGVENQASRALFRSAGFREVGVKKAWNRTPDGYEDELLLQRMID